MHDEILLRDYAQTRSEAAFAQLMNKHFPMVYSVCLRETEDRALAEDAAQAVFLTLSRKAKSLRSPRALQSWLYQTARLSAKAHKRREHVRRRKETEAVPAEYPASSAPSLVNLMLDEAIDTLSARDRDAILLRYFAGLSIVETAGQLGVSEGAAQMRINRALNKLQRYLARRDAAVTGIGLVTLLAGLSGHDASAATSCPSAIAGSAGQPAGLPLHVSAYHLPQGISRAMAMTNTKIAAACGGTLLLLGGGAGAYLHETRASGKTPLRFFGAGIGRSVAPQTPNVEWGAGIVKAVTTTTRKDGLPYRNFQMSLPARSSGATISAYVVTDKAQLLDPTNRSNPAISTTLKPMHLQTGQTMEIPVGFVVSDPHNRTISMLVVWKPDDRSLPTGRQAVITQTAGPAPNMNISLNAVQVKGTCFDVLKTIVAFRNATIVADPAPLLAPCTEHWDSQADTTEILTTIATSAGCKLTKQGDMYVIDRQ